MTWFLMNNDIHLRTAIAKKGVYKIRRRHYGLALKGAGSNPNVCQSCGFNSTRFRI